jgi:hypothetical protein
LSGELVGFNEKLEYGSRPSVRGVVKCLNCKHYQSWISYNSKRIVVGPRRTSTCMKCGRRNRWRIQSTHGNAQKFQCVTFMKRDSKTPRIELVREAQFLNHGGSLKFETY